MAGLRVQYWWFLGCFEDCHLWHLLLGTPGAKGVFVTGWWSVQLQAFIFPPLDTSTKLLPVVCRELLKCVCWSAALLTWGG